MKSSKEIRTVRQFYSCVRRDERCLCGLPAYHLRSEAMPLIGRLFLRKMEEQMWFPDAVGGLTLGADPIAFAIARESLDRPPAIDCFVVRKERKQHGMQRFVEGLESTEGRKVVIVEDVCTKGESTAPAIRNAKSVGMDILGAICLIDREAGGAELLRNESGADAASPIAAISSASRATRRNRSSAASKSSSASCRSTFCSSPA